MKRKGFTLIELIVVMAIIAILVLIAAPKFIGYTEKAKLTQVINDIKVSEKAAEQYYLQHDLWPRDQTATPYTLTQLNTWVDDFRNLSGENVTLEPGDYYDVDWDKLKPFMAKPNNNFRYIIQNPVGDVYYANEIKETAINNGKFVDPVILSENNRPVAIIDETNLANLKSNSVITWNHLSTDSDGQVIDTEWIGKETTYATPGSYTVKLRVKDNLGMWSEWDEVTFNVASVNFTPTTLSAEVTIGNVNGVGSFDFKVDSKGNINYFWFYNGGIFRAVYDKTGTILVTKDILVLTGVRNVNWDANLYAFKVELDENDNIYLAYTKNSDSIYAKKFNPDGSLLMAEKLIHTRNKATYFSLMNIDFNISGNNIYFLVNDFGCETGCRESMYILKYDKSFTYISKNITPVSSFSIKDSKIIDNGNGFTLMTLSTGSASGNFTVQVITLGTDYKIQKNIQIFASARRFLGDFQLDTNGRVWIVDNLAYNDNYNVNAYLMKADLSGIEKTTRVFTGAIDGYTRIEKLSDGKLMIGYISASKFRTKTLE